MDFNFPLIHFFKQRHQLLTDFCGARIRYLSDIDFSSEKTR